MKNIIINKNTSILNALKKMNNAGTRCLVVIDKDKTLLGTLTDGDLRRIILRTKNLQLKINKSYNENCIFYFEKTMNIKNIRKEMLDKKIDLVPVVDKRKKLKSYITIDEDLIYSSSSSKKNIKNPVIIMAGGKGSRLDPFTRVLPKPLIPIGNQTMIEKIINSFSKQGFKKFYLSLNYKANIIENYLSDINNNTKINYIREKKFLGTAGSLSLLKSKFNNDIIITNCDTIVEINFKEILDYHKKNKYDLTIVASTKEFEVPYGTCVLNSVGELKKLKEKPKYNLLVNVGLYILKPELLKLVKKNTFLSMSDFINNLQSKSYKIGVFPCHENFWKDVGQWEEYEKSLKNIKH
jgi:dTDP-glucose pyrophosphorylase/predicted transcriptional regulator